MMPSPAADAAAARADYEARYRRSLDDPQGFWLAEAARLRWDVPPATAGRWDFGQVDFAWYEGARLNACVNCVDRHAAADPDRTAVIWAADEPGRYENISYGQLRHEVCRAANALAAAGVRPGDRVCLYLPMIPELVVTMLACARLGAVHSIVFAGFSADALRDRILDAGCSVVVTANEGRRGGRSIPLKATVDDAVRQTPCVRTVFVARRTDAEVPMAPGRDVWLHEAMAAQRGTCPAAAMDAEAPLFILYTSGSTGKPKGVLHTTGGYLVYAALTHEVVFDLRPDDVYCCAADIGWITGHSYVVYGPLANGATTVMFESTPLFPDPGRYWRMVDELGITVFYTAPTALRAILREGDDWVRRHDRGSLRVLGTVGEPINPEVWRWYHDVVGGGRCAVVDTWWQTETGGVLITPVPGVHAPKPGAAMRPFFGVEPVVVDGEGRELTGNGVRGNLCLKRSWPGQARTLYGDHARFRETYFRAFPGLYFTGDGCRRDEDGDYWITGRVDDVLNVSGHRLGTAEIESALVGHPAVAEAAVVGFPHDLKGEGIHAFVLVTPEHEALDDDAREALVASLKDQVRTAIGGIAVPDRVQIAAGLPKTRSGKIMRRILRKIAAGETDPAALGDVTTLADPGVVHTLVAKAAAARAS